LGVIDGVLFAVGGDDGSGTLKSVEAYRPSTEALDYNDRHALVSKICRYKYSYNNSKLFYETMNLNVLHLN